MNITLLVKWHLPNIVTEILPLIKVSKDSLGHEKREQTFLIHTYLQKSYQDAMTILLRKDQGQQYLDSYTEWG